MLGVEFNFLVLTLVFLSCHLFRVYIFISIILHMHFGGNYFYKSFKDREKWTNSNSSVKIKCDQYYKCFAGARKNWLKNWKNPEITEQGKADLWKKRVESKHNLIKFFSPTISFNLFLSYSVFTFLSFPKEVPFVICMIRLLVPCYSPLYCFPIPVLEMVPFYTSDFCRYYNLYIHTCRLRVRNSQ